MKQSLTTIFVLAILLIFTNSLVFAESKNRSKSGIYYLVIFEVKNDLADVQIDSDGSILCDNQKIISTIKAHSGYMDEMYNKGFLFSGGPVFKDFEYKKNTFIDGAMFIYNTSTKVETERIAKNDPFILSGVMTIKYIRPFKKSI